MITFQLDSSIYYGESSFCGMTMVKVQREKAAIKYFAFSLKPLPSTDTLDLLEKTMILSDLRTVPALPTPTNSQLQGRDLLDVTQNVL